MGAEPVASHEIDAVLGVDWMFRLSQHVAADFTNVEEHLFRENRS